jgi:hypothetical protein
LAQKVSKGRSAHCPLNSVTGRAILFPPLQCRKSRYSRMLFKTQVIVLIYGILHPEGLFFKIINNLVAQIESGKVS